MYETMGIMQGTMKKLHTIHHLCSTNVPYKDKRCGRFVNHFVVVVDLKVHLEVRDLDVRVEGQ